MTSDRPCVLVTGAGRGLGRAIATSFHDHGYFVVATDFDEGLLADLSDTEGYVTFQHDVSQVERGPEIAALIEERCGRLDVIVNNAGINPFYPVSEAPPARTIQGFMVNTFGALITSQACLDLLIASKGRIVNIASESSTFRAPFQFYQSSKMALECLSDVLRRELMLFDVHVAFIRPGAIQTNLLDDLDSVPIDLPGSRFEPYFDKLRKMIAGAAPKTRSDPKDVAALVFHAATDPKKKVMYRINNQWLQRVVARLPAKLVDRILLRQLRG